MDGHVRACGGLGVLITNYLIYSAHSFLHLLPPVNINTNNPNKQTSADLKGTRRGLRTPASKIKIKLKINGTEWIF